MADEVASVVDTPDAEMVTDDSSMADHESLFGAPDLALDGDAKAENEAKREKVRHRAKSQEAAPADVPRIQKFTKDLRERDEKLSAAETRIRELEARLSQPSTAPALVTPAPASPSGPERGASGQLQPTRPKPTMAMIDAGTYESFEAMNDDLVEWKLEQREAKRAQEDQQRQQEQQRNQANQSFQQAHASFATKLEAFKQTHADYDTLAAQHQQTLIPPPAYKAILTHDNGPAFVYHLFTHPDVLAEMQFLMADRPPTDEYVALATRWLSSRIQAAQTGSAASTPLRKAAPDPPNPVRTGPIKAADDLPGEDASLAEHEKAFGRKRR